MIVLGLNSALRISDILPLRWQDVFDFEKDKYKTHVWIREKKTGKSKKFLLNNNAREALEKLKKDLGNTIQPNDYIFLSREGENKPITRIQALNIVKQSANAVGIKERVGTHSLRKSFGYHSWKKGVPLALLTEIFNHSNQQTTKLYLGITQDDMDDVYRTVEL